MTFKIDSVRYSKYGDLIKNYPVLKDFGVRYAEDGGAEIFIESLGSLRYLLEKLQADNDKRIGNARVEGFVFELEKITIYDGYLE